MKKYMPPRMDRNHFRQEEAITSLSQWLSDHTLTDAGITTYLINS